MDWALHSHHLSSQPALECGAWLVCRTGSERPESRCGRRLESWLDLVNSKAWQSGKEKMASCTEMGSLCRLLCRSWSGRSYRKYWTSRLWIVATIEVSKFHITKGLLYLMLLMTDTEARGTQLITSELREASVVR